MTQRTNRVWPIWRVRDLIVFACGAAWAKRLQCGFTFPHRQRPEMALREFGIERVRHKPGRVFQLPHDSERLNQEPWSAPKPLERKEREQREIFSIALTRTQ